MTNSPPTKPWPSSRPRPAVVEIAKALKVSADEFLGLKPPPKAARLPEDPVVRRLWKKFQQVLSLPEKDRRAVIRLVNSFVAGRAFAAR